MTLTRNALIVINRLGQVREERTRKNDAEKLSSSIQLIFFHSINAGS
jgi:hypothetical protein